MDNNQFLSESTSFFALKKSIHLINLISKYLSKNNNVAWSDVLKSQSDVQQFINYAVKSNFPNDSLDAYKLNLPLVPDCVGPETNLANIGHHQTLAPFSGQESLSHLNHDVLPLVNPHAFSNDCLKLGSEELSQTYGYHHYNGSAHVNNNQIDISNINLKPAKLSLSSSVISTDYCSTEVGCSSEPNNKESTDGDMPNLFETEEEEEVYKSEGIPKVEDSLSSAREKYMNLINTKSIPTLDSSIPPQMFNSNVSYLFKEDFPFSEKVNEINRSVFGFSSFRGVQLAAINSILLGMDCFVLMATGVGKSHCYQLPSLLLNGVVVVFSPLLSLVDDQMNSLQSHGIEAQTLNAKTPMPVFRAISKSLTDKHREFLNGSILFITPEKFDKSKSVLNLLKTLYEIDRLKLFVIDEVHCVSQWGHSFRRDYRKLSNLKQNFSNVPILAVTATATPEVITDITSVLRMRKCVTLITTINRPNLWIEVREKNKNYMDEIVQILLSTTGCGIVYCLTTSDCEKVAEKITANGITASVYHAKMDLEDRTNSQKLWKNGDVRIIVATVAFGMGIDKADVRLILHTSAPTSILSYYQEIGRAGRDGKFSTTILWYSPRDFERHKNISESKHTNNYNYSSEMRDFCSNRTTCRRKMILNAFGEDSNITSCLGCDNCCLNLSCIIVDVTEEATSILNFVRECMAYRSKGILTANILSDALRGSKRSLITKYRLDDNAYHGSLKSLSQKRIFEILVKMVKLKILKECRRRSMSFGRTVLIEGSNATKLLGGLMKVTIPCYDNPNQTKTEDSTSTSQNGQSQSDSKSSTRSKSKSKSTSDSKIITISEFFTDEPRKVKRTTSENGSAKNPIKKSKKKKTDSIDGLINDSINASTHDLGDDSKYNLNIVEDDHACVKSNVHALTISNTDSPASVKHTIHSLNDSMYHTMHKTLDSSIFDLKYNPSDNDASHCTSKLGPLLTPNLVPANTSRYEPGEISQVNGLGNEDVDYMILKPAEFIDLTKDSEVLAYSTCASNDELSDNENGTINYSLYRKEFSTQTQRELTKSDIITLGKNNLRRKIPGALFEASQT